MMEPASVFLNRLAKQPLVTRRHALQALFTARAIVRRSDGFDLAPILRHTLRLGDRASRRLDREIAFHDSLTSLEWLALLVRTTDQLIADSRRVTIDEPATLSRIAGSGKPVVLAPLHMGNYVFGLAVLMKTFFPNRPMLILRAREDHVADTLVMERIREIGTEMRFLQVADKANYVDAVRFVRQGAVVIYFVDLPPSYGGPVDVVLFGQPMRLALGLDSFARVTGATVLPIATRSSPRGDRIMLGKPFEVVDAGRGERARIAGLIAHHIESAVLRDPDQWHFWPRFAEFAPIAPTDAHRTLEVAA